MAAATASNNSPIVADRAWNATQVLGLAGAIADLVADARK
jgi:hypothetical protein